MSPNSTAAGVEADVIETLSDTVSPGLPEADDRLSATFCPMHQDAVSKAKTGTDERSSAAENAIRIDCVLCKSTLREQNRSEKYPGFWYWKIRYGHPSNDGGDTWFSRSSLTPF